MAFGTRRAAVAAVVVVSGAIALVPFVLAQSTDRDLPSDVFRAFGAGSEIGLSVREMSNDEASKAGLERPGGVLVSAVEERSFAPDSYIGDRCGGVSQNCC